MYYLSNVEVTNLARALVDDIVTDWSSESDFSSSQTALAVYPVPRGGVPVAYAIGQFLNVEVVDSPAFADIIVDDLIDSGATKERFRGMTKRTGDNATFYALVDKPSLPEEHPYKDWLVFPWERGLDGNEESATDNVVRLLQYIGEDASREGLQETPARVLKALREKTSGYQIKEPGTLLKAFVDGSADELVIVRDITFDSMCEHHLERISGTVSIGYIPNGKIVGLSKFARVTDAYAHRLQVQERLTTQIADCINDTLLPHGVAVLVRATHGCMECRGVRRHGAVTITSALRGCFKDDIAARAEVMALLK